MDGLALPPPDTCTFLVFALSLRRIPERRG